MLLYANGNNLPPRRNIDDVQVGDVRQASRFIYSHPLLSPAVAGCNSTWLSGRLNISSRVNEIPGIVPSAFELTGLASIAEETQGGGAARNHTYEINEAIADAQGFL